MILIKHENQGNLKPYFYFALEEYILKYLLKDDESYFFTWKIKGVVIGKNQLLENEVNLNYLKENNIDIFRRPTGGGTIYADENNTMYSMITKRTSNFSFKPYLNLIIKAMKKLGVEISFSGRNDLLYDGKKISGVAFLQNKYGVLIHGTFMYDVNIEALVKSITVDDEKLISKGIESVRSRVTNLKPVLKGLSLDELICHFESEITTKTYILSNDEISKINKMAEKYEDKAWRFLIQPAHSKKISKRISGGKFDITFNLNRGIIEDIKINGDFLDLMPVEIIENALKNVIYDKQEIKKALSKINLESIILDINSEEFINILLPNSIY